MSGIGSGGFALAASLTVAATPSLNGVYQVGEVGLVEFATDGGVVVGRYRGGGACEFEPSLKVVTGSFEGSVFVGTVVLCQTGPQCPPRRAFPMLGFFREERMLGMVRFEPGCTSRATDDRRLLFIRATEEAPAGSHPEDRSAVDPPPLEVSSGRAWLGLAAAQQSRGDYAAALGSLLKAEALVVQREGERSGLFAQVEYQLACAWAHEGKKREAMRALKGAVKASGPAILDRLDRDPQLEPIRGEPEFARLAGELRVQRAKKEK